MIFLQDCYVHVLLIVLAVDRGDKEGRAKFLKMSLIYFLLSFFSKFHEVKNLFSEVLNFFSSPVRLCCGGGSRVGTRLTLAWMTCTLVHLVKKIVIETACVMVVDACVTMGFKVRRCKSY